MITHAFQSLIGRLGALNSHCYYFIIYCLIACPCPVCVCVCVCVCVYSKIKTQKGSNERLFILTRTHSMHIFGEIPFIKPQNDTKTTDKRLKTMKNERKRLIFFFFLSFLVEFLQLVRCLEDCWHCCLQ